MFEFDYPSSGRLCSSVVRFGCEALDPHLVGRVSGRVGSPTGHTLGVFLWALPDKGSKKSERVLFDI